MKRKNLFLTFLLAALMLGGAVNSQAFAQESLFGRESGGPHSITRSSIPQEGLLYQGGRSTSTVGLTLGGVTNNENPTSEAPLGSGVVLLMAAGAGYALLKRKEEQQ